VMYTDPTGYFSLGEMDASAAIQNILNKIATVNVGSLWNLVNKLATLYDTGRQIQLMLSEGKSAEQIAEALARGAIVGFLLGNMCNIKLTGPIISSLVITISAVSQLDSITEAVDKGQWDLVFVRSIQLIVLTKGLTQSCFTGDTPVAAEDGQKRIDEIQVGDKVWAYNVETGEKELKEVLKVFIKSNDEILHLYTTDGDVDTTANHPFYVVGKGWVAAGDLQAGDRLQTLDGSAAVVIGFEVEKLDKPIAVYNLEIDGLHTYFVGSGLLVHNKYSMDGKPSTSTEPTEAYNRKKHYGNTPSTSDRQTIGGSPDHEPPLVQRYYEGDPNTGEPPGYLQTPDERRSSANDRTRMKPSTVEQQRKQGGAMSVYSKEQKKIYGLS